jgi:hypothetical protein
MYLSHKQRWRKVRTTPALHSQHRQTPDQGPAPASEPPPARSWPWDPLSWAQPKQAEPGTAGSTSIREPRLVLPRSASLSAIGALGGGQGGGGSPPRSILRRRSLGGEWDAAGAGSHYLQWGHGPKQHAFARTRRAHFDKCVHVVLVPSRTDMTDDQRGSVWWTCDEILAFRRRAFIYWQLHGKDVMKVSSQPPWRCTMRGSTYRHLIRLASTLGVFESLKVANSK